MIIKQQAKPFILLMQEGEFITRLVIGIRVRVALCALLAAELSAMVQKPSLAEQLSPLRFLDDFLLLRRSPSSSLLLELEVEYTELESTSLAPTIAQALPRLYFLLDRRSSLCLFLSLLLWSCLDQYFPSDLDLCL
jgi:hypothetical protein